MGQGCCDCFYPVTGRALTLFVTVMPGRTRTILIALHGTHAGLLWISVHGRNKRLMLETVISVSWPSRVSTRR